MNCSYKMLQIVRVYGVYSLSNDMAHIE